MFNQYANATVNITIKNLPYVAGVVRKTMLSYEYAKNCEWYEAMQKAETVKAIFDIVGVKFSLNNNNFYPIVKDFAMTVNLKNMLEAIASYMSDGQMFVKDDYHYYILTFKGGKITGTRRKVEDGNPLEVKKVDAPTLPPVKTNTSKPTPKKTTTKKTVKKSTVKKYCKTQVRTDTYVTTITARSDNRYTVQELVKELLRQMDNGNGDKYVEVKADFLFKNAKYA